MTVEGILNDCGGFGKFQLLAFVGILSHKLNMGWSMMQMNFAGLIPEWYCVVNKTTNIYTNQTSEKCSLNDSLTGFQQIDCHSFHFEGPSRTAITEWDLVCDLKWTKALITSIQMVGVLVGAILAGQSADTFGRKKTLYGFALAHALLNFGAAFSTSWEMFAVFRFFLGICVGTNTVVAYPYLMEFLPLKWRPLVSIIPVWSAGICLFALTAMLLEDWSYLHIGCGAVGVLLCLGYVIIPESPRWLTLQGRLKEAEGVLEKMASVNGRPLPSQTKSVLEKVYAGEVDSRNRGKKPSYLIFFKTWKQAKISLPNLYLWFILSLVFYGLSFGVSALAGNLYLNIVLLAIVDIPSTLATFYFNNKIGRKWTCIALLSLVALASGGCVVVESAAPSNIKGTWIMGLSLVAKMGISSAWAVSQIWCNEIFPTSVRSLGYGLVNSAARLGGIAAPFVIDLDNRALITYIVMTVSVIVAEIGLLPIPDTKGRILVDSLIDSISITVEPAEKDGIKIKSAAKSVEKDSFKIKTTTRSVEKVDINIASTVIKTYASIPVPTTENNKVETHVTKDQNSFMPNVKNHHEGNGFIENGNDKSNSADSTNRKEKEIDITIITKF